MKVIFFLHHKKSSQNATPPTDLGSFGLGFQLILPTQTFGEQKFHRFHGVSRFPTFWGKSRDPATKNSTDSISVLLLQIFFHESSFGGELQLNFLNKTRKRFLS